jgi:hypothetical protein
VRKTCGSKTFAMKRKQQVVSFGVKSKLRCGDWNGACLHASRGRNGAQWVVGCRPVEMGLRSLPSGDKTE